MLIHIETLKSAVQKFVKNEVDHAFETIKDDPSMAAMHLGDASQSLDCLVKLLKYVKDDKIESMTITNLTWELDTFPRETLWDYISKEINKPAND